MEFKISNSKGETVRVEAGSQAAARAAGRAMLGAGRDERVTAKRDRAISIDIGQMNPDEQLRILVLYEQLLVSKVSLDTAFAKLGSKIKAPQRGEAPSETLLRSGFHPVVCAILAAGEAAGRAHEGASRGSDWLNDRQLRQENLINPALRQAAFSLSLVAGLFALPVAAHNMFSLLPRGIVKIKHTGVSQFLVDAYAILFEPFPTWIVLTAMWLVFGGLLWYLAKSPAMVRSKVPMLGPLMELKAQETLTAWLSIFLPFHTARLPYNKFVRAGVKACKKGELAESFRALKLDVDAGEADSISTAVEMRPTAVPKGCASRC